MTDEPQCDLVGKLRRLLEVGLTDEHYAIARFHLLVDRYGRDEVGRAVATLAREAREGDQLNP